MNTETLDNVKSFACTVAALIVTTVLSWSFVDSTSVLRWAGGSAVVAGLAAATGPASEGGGTSRSVLLD